MPRRLSAIPSRRQPRPTKRGIGLATPSRSRGRSLAPRRRREGKKAGGDGKERRPVRRRTSPGRWNKRWLILAVVGLVGLAGVTVARTGFPDVPEDHLHREAIEWSQQVGAFQGYPDGTFRPDLTITAEQATIVFGRVYPDGVSRAEFAALLYEGKDLLAVPTGPTTTTTSTSTTTTTVAPSYSHEHFARITNGGRCDQRFTRNGPWVPCHSHPADYPQHREGNHRVTPSTNC